MGIGELDSGGALGWRSIPGGRRSGRPSRRATIAALLSLRLLRSSLASSKCSKPTMVSWSSCSAVGVGGRASSAARIRPVIGRWRWALPPGWGRPWRSHSVISASLWDWEPVAGRASEMGTSAAVLKVGGRGSGGGTAGDRGPPGSKEPAAALEIGREGAPYPCMAAGSGGAAVLGTGRRVAKEASVCPGAPRAGQRGVAWA